MIVLVERFNREEFELLLAYKEEWLQSNGKYRCPICGKECSKYGIKNHLKVAHFQYPNSTAGKPAWNKGLTKDTDERVALITDKVSDTLKGKPGHKISEETRAKISDSMKKAHAEGRAWNIGMSRWNNEPSYPEKFFMRVIDNEFTDKNYIREYRFLIYSLDFAWPHLKKCIEIDGEQHQRFIDYIERDKRKDTALVAAGWKILHICWKDFYNNPKKWINIAKCFIEEI